jgi:predicted O-methyltransferase YrrM
MLMIPRLQKALDLAQANHFESSCIPEVGQLLHLLVAQAKPGVIAEIGTGYGVGSAWMLNGLRENQQLFSVELDKLLHQEVSKIFASESRITLLQGDWRDILCYKPFQLVFVDIGVAKDEGHQDVIEATAVGGLIVLDDFTPLHLRENKRDTRRERWLTDPRLITTEILTTATTSALLAVRTS